MPLKSESESTRMSQMVDQGVFNRNLYSSWIAQQVVEKIPLD